MGSHDYFIPPKFIKIDKAVLEKKSKCEKNYARRTTEERQTNGRTTRYDKSSLNWTFGAGWLKGEGHIISTSLLSSPESKARVSYCHSALYVRPSDRLSSSVRRKLFTFSTSSPEPLGGFWWNLVGIKYTWSLTSVIVFRPDPPRGGSRAGHK